MRDLRDGMVYDRASFTWITPEEMAARDREREERMAERKTGLARPMVISDSLGDGVQSMADGKVYTSKARLRAEYRAHGVEEVGNDSSLSKRRMFDPSDDGGKGRRDAIDKGFFKAGVGE